MTTDNALSFVGQIMTAYKAVLKTEGNALDRAIECGCSMHLLAHTHHPPTKGKGDFSGGRTPLCHREGPNPCGRLSKQIHRLSIVLDERWAVLEVRRSLKAKTRA